MDRRRFLKLSAQAALAVGALGVSRTLEAAPRKAPKMTKKHWIWTSVNPNATEKDLKSRYAALKAHGLSGVFISGMDDREFEIARAAGLEVHVWMWTTNRGDAWIRENHPDWYMVSRTGKSCFDQPPYVGYYRWVSPVIPGVVDYLKDRVAEIAKHPAVNGVHLDYVRYPDVILPNGLWKQYGVDQTEEMPEYDFCYSDHTRKAFQAATGRDPMDIEDPAHDQEWLHFRYDSVTKLVVQLAGVAKAHKKEITAAVFPTPSMARTICRQDWDKWPLDAVCPMIYHSFYEEDVDWIGKAMRENVQAVRFPVYAGLYMEAFKTPEEFRRGLRLVAKRGGGGVSLFGGVGDEYWKVFEEEAA